MDEKFGDERVLIVTYRQTLAYNLDSKLMGFHNYLDGMEEMNDRERRPRVICQLDSILATCETSREVPKFDLVVLDEVASLIGHTAAPTLRSPVKVMSMFVRILQTAERVLTMDALWGGESHDFLTACGVEGRLIVNTQRSASRCFEMSADVDQWEAQIAEDLSEGKNIVLASMSSEAIYRVVDAVKRVGILGADDILVHTGKTDDELKKGLLQVETFWRKRFVAYSPTIEVSD